MGSFYYRKLVLVREGLELLKGIPDHLLFVSIASRNQVVPCLEFWDLIVELAHLRVGLLKFWHQVLLIVMHYASELLLLKVLDTAILNCIFLAAVHRLHHSNWFKGNRALCVDILLLHLWEVINWDWLVLEPFWDLSIFIDFFIEVSNDELILNYFLLHFLVLLR